MQFLTALLDAKKKMPGLIETIPLLCISVGLFVIALTFIRTKSPESAVFLAQVVGLIAWVSAREITKILIRSEDSVSIAVALGIPILIGIGVYRVFIRGLAATRRADVTGV